MFVQFELVIGGYRARLMHTRTTYERILTTPPSTIIIFFCVSRRFGEFDLVSCSLHLFYLQLRVNDFHFHMLLALKEILIVKFNPK